MEWKYGPVLVSYSWRQEILDNVYDNPSSAGIMSGCLSPSAPPLILPKGAFVWEGHTRQVYSNFKVLKKNVVNLTELKT